MINYNPDVIVYSGSKVLLLNIAGYYTGPVYIVYYIIHEHTVNNIIIIYACVI